MTGPAPVPEIGQFTVGTQGTFTGPLADQVPAIERQVVVHDNESSPLMTYLMVTQGRLEDTPQQDYSWYENQYDIPTLAVTAGITGGSETATVTIPSLIVVGQMYSHALSNQYFITQSISYPGDGTTTAVIARLDGAKIVAVAGPATLIDCSIGMIENGRFADASGIIPAKYTNTTGKITDSISVTDEDSKAEQYWGWPWQQNKEFVITRYKKRLERTMLMSQYSVTNGYTQHSVNGDRTGTLRTPSGLIEAIKTNTLSFTGTLTKETFNQYLRNGVWPNQYSGSNMKIALLGPDANLDIQNWITTQYRTTSPGAQMYGVQLTGYVYGSHRLVIMEEPQFFNVDGFKHGVMVIDPTFVTMKKYGLNAPFVEMKDTTPPDGDWHSMSLTSNMSLQTKFEQSHSTLTNPS